MTTDGRQKSQQRLGRSSAILFAANLISRMSGFLRTMVLAISFGTQSGTDAYVMASALPNLLFGAVNTSITMTTVPILSDADAHYSPSSVEELLNQVWSGLLILSLFLVGLGEWTAPWVMALLAPGFHGPELRLTILLTRIMIPTMVFWGSAGLMVGILQAREVYAGPALSPLVVNMVQIAGIVVLGRWLRFEGVALGFTLAVACQVLWLVPLMRRQDVHLRWRWPWNHPLARRLLKLMWPFFIVSSASSVEVIIDRILASSMVTGSISAMNFSYTLSQVPMGLIIAPLTTPVFTRLSRHHASRDSVEFAALARRGLRLILLSVLPLAVAFFLFRVPILRLIYEHGAFTARSLHLTSDTLEFFSLGMPAVALTAYFQQLSFARQQTRKPAQYSVMAVALNIVGNLVLTRWLAVGGLVLATTLASWLNCILLWKDYRFGPGLLRLLARLSLATFSMTLVSATLIDLTRLNQMSGILMVLTLAVIGGLGLAAYGLVLALFRVPEVLAGRRLILRLARRTASHMAWGS